MNSYNLWADNRITCDETAELGVWEARADYLAWATDLGHPRQPLPKQRAAIRRRGGKPKGRGRALVYQGVRLASPLWDSGYRAGGRQLPPEPCDPLPALHTLHQAGLVTDRATLNRAWTELGGTR